MARVLVDTPSGGLFPSVLETDTSAPRHIYGAVDLKTVGVPTAGDIWYATVPYVPTAHAIPSPGTLPSPSLLPGS